MSPAFRLLADLALALLLVVCAAIVQGQPAYLPVIKNAQDQPDHSRLPRFFTSDPAYDEFINDYFMRHLSIDERGIYLGGGPVLGATDHMWVIEWDWWMLPWIDRGAMGLLRQGKADVDVILNTLAHAAVDKYGYTFGGRLTPEPNDSLGGYLPTFCWPWPKYNRNYTVTRPTGWDFNDPADGARGQWTVRDIELEPGYVDHCLAGTVTGPRPELISPKFDCDVFQIPIVEIDIAYSSPPKQGADKLIDGLKVYWTTDAAPRFSEDRMVTVDFADLPPRDFPGDYARLVSESHARYPLFFPMCLHPEWGREGRRITRLKLVPTGSGAEGARISLNYIRASYDVRLSTTNSTLINATCKFFMWSGDEKFLRVQMPRLRRAMLFMNEHLQGRKDALLNFDWYVGHDGLGGEESGHGVYGSYWDLLPGGRFDIESSAAYYYALSSMAQLEKAAKARGIEAPRVQVVGPDNKTLITYRETPESLARLAARVKKRIEAAFWSSETGRFARNIDINGVRHDYGFLHHNLTALAFGVGTEAQRESILSWLDGRVVPGDTSTGKDIYHWRFAPRATTRRNETYYYWAWIHDRKHWPDSPQFVWGNQMQDGGAVPFTSLFDMMARTASGDQAQIDKASERTREVERWFLDVKAAGGEGRDFYRAYYDNHPERGRQQSPQPGGLGLDREFLSDASLGTVFIPCAFLGIDAREDGVLDIAPAVPSRLEKIGAANIHYRGNHLTIEAGRGYVSLQGSRIPRGEGLKLRLLIRKPPPRFRCMVDGKPCASVVRNRDGSATATIGLAPVRVEIVPGGSR